MISHSAHSARHYTYTLSPALSLGHPCCPVEECTSPVEPMMCAGRSLFIANAAHMGCRLGLLVPPTPCREKRKMPIFCLPMTAKIFWAYNHPRGSLSYPENLDGIVLPTLELEL